MVQYHYADLWQKIFLKKKTENTNSTQAQLLPVSTKPTSVDTSVATRRGDYGDVNKSPPSTAVQSNVHHAGTIYDNVLDGTMVNGLVNNFGSTGVEATESKKKKTTDSITRDNIDVQQYDAFFENFEESQIQMNNYESENSEISFFSANESVQWSHDEAL